MNQKTSVPSYSVKSVLSPFSELNYIKDKQKITTNRLLAGQILLRDQNLKWSGDTVLIFCSVETLCSNHLLLCRGRTTIFSKLLIQHQSSTLKQMLKVPKNSSGKQNRVITPVLKWNLI